MRCRTLDGDGAGDVRRRARRRVGIGIGSCPGRAPTVLDGTATPLCEMDAGDGDQDAVAVLQQSLVHCHGQTVTIDGQYGPQTAEAVTAVQRQAGIAPDGEYGPATLEVMRWPVDGATQAPDCAAGVSRGSVWPTPTPPCRRRGEGLDGDAAAAPLRHRGYEPVAADVRNPSTRASSTTSTSASGAVRVG